ncbi:MAG: hypothetical protein R3F07_07290 [Opitutaceae bacterium]
MPVVAFKQVLLNRLELALGRAHYADGVLLSQVIEIVRADHSPVHDPDTIGNAVFVLHQLDNLLDGGDVASVAGKHSEVDVWIIWCYLVSDHW